LVKYGSAVLQGKYRYKLNRVENVLNTSSLLFNNRIIHKRAYTQLGVIKSITSSLKNKIDIEDYISTIMKKCTYKDEFYKMMYLNFKYDLPNDYLVKVDRMSMAHSLETRVPFLDFRLVEFMSKVHKNIKMQGYERKSVLKRTVAKKLPNSLLSAPKKGFGIPLREWFKEDGFMQNIYFENVSNILNSSAISKVIEDNNTGARDNGNFIWTLLMLDNFLN